MVGLRIEYDEEIFAEASGVRWLFKLGNMNQYFDILVLTNKRIYGVYQKGNGLFKKPSEEMMELRLADIKITNGQPIVSKKWDFNNLCWILEIQTNQGLHTFVFQEASKKNASLWETEIYKSFGLSTSSDDQADAKKNGLSGIASNLKDVAESVLNKTANQVNVNKCNDKPSNNNNDIPVQQSSEIPPIPNSQSPKNRYCSNCGAKLNDSEKFCHNCGMAIGMASQQTSFTHSTHTSTGNYTSRVQEFAGTVLKCPNCGNVISSLDAVCSACGMHITGKAASWSVQKFSDALMEIEKVKTVENKGGLFAQIGYEERVQNAYASYYSQKLTLIRTFPIPNTVEEIYELMMLAVTNIDVKISKNTLWNKMENSRSSAKEVSDAWIQKMRQAYQKAFISFPNDPVFSYIQKIYFEKMDELKIKP